MMGGKLCSKVCPTCKFQQSFTVTEKATGAVSVRWDCALAFQTQLLMEGNLFTAGVQAAVESFRNETVRQTAQMLGGSVKIAERMLTAAERQGNGNVQRSLLACGDAERSGDTT